MTALIEAIRHREYESTKDLIARSRDISERDDKGQDALFWAVYQGWPEIVELLLAKGADINARYAEGYTPLCWAVGQDHTDIVHLLIEKGTDINVGLPLITAAKCGREDAAMLLIEKGADIEAKDSYGMTALDYAQSKAPSVAIVLQDMLEARRRAADEKHAAEEHAAASLRQKALRRSAPKFRKGGPV